MITSATDLFCVMGSPVSHSKSPVLHNAALKAHGIDGVYLAFEPPNAKAAAEAVKALGIKGASITIPFKEDIMAHLDEIDETARKIGAVNTLVHKEGKLLGYNTDCQAAVDPLLPYGIADKTICLVGAGGAAKAVAYGIQQNGGKLIVTNRSSERGQNLAAQFQGRFIPLDRAEQIQADVVINTTSLGMTPNTDQLSFPAQALHKKMVVMDVVYTPIETLLLKTAREKGCITIDGLSMFVAQAAAQFTLWTGIIPDSDPLRQSIMNASETLDEIPKA